MSDERSTKQVEQWKALATQASQVAEMCRTEGFKILKEKIEARIADKKNMWLKAKTAESAEIIRIKASVYSEFFDITGRIIKEGQNAQNLLSQFYSDDSNI